MLDLSWLAVPPLLLLPRALPALRRARTSWHMLRAMNLPTRQLLAMLWQAAARKENARLVLLPLLAAWGFAKLRPKSRFVSCARFEIKILRPINFLISRNSNRL